MAYSSDISSGAWSARSPSEIPAQEVRKLCLQLEPGVQEIAFERKKVIGLLDLHGLQLDRTVTFTDCDFTGPIVLTGAHASKGIRLEGCKILSLWADRLGVDGDLVLERVCSQGEISLCGARLTGHLRCTGSKLSQPNGKALNAKGMIVEGSALFDGGFSSVGEFILTSARIRGTVDMSGGSFSNTAGPALMAEGIGVDAGMFLDANFEGPVILEEAHVSGKIKCTGGLFAAPGQMAISAKHLETDVIFLNQDFKAIGEVCLDGSKVASMLDCRGGKFTNPGGIALSANGLVCQDVFLSNGFAAAGEVQLFAARISRELSCANGWLDNKGGYSLNALGLICDGRIYLNENFTASGAVLLRNARIQSELNCTNGAFASLLAGRMTCDGDIYLNERFRVIGEVSLTDATVGHELNCRDGTFGELHAKGLTVGTTFDWRPRVTPEEVDVSSANVGFLRDEPTSWPAGATRLAGFTFKSVDMIMIAPQRIQWLRRADYAPDVYKELIQIYRQKGRGRDSQILAIASQRDRRRRGGMSWSSRAWSRFLDLTVGYGYRMDRPLLIVLLGASVGTIMFYYAQRYGVMEPIAAGQGTVINANKCTPNYPCFNPATYSFEIFLPVLNFGQLRFWQPSAVSLFGKFLLLWIWIVIIYSWTISIAIAVSRSNFFSSLD